MNPLMEQIATCVLKGKTDANSPFPPDMAGQDGASELIAQALEEGIAPEAIMAEGLISGMEEVGEKWRKNEIFLPEVMLASKVIDTGMQLLEKYFSSGDIQHKGVFVIGTVEGDLHDIGKNMVKMFFQGGGWKVVDLGVDKGVDAFKEAIEEHKPAVVGISALLTTTMGSMGEVTKQLVAEYPAVKVLVGGAPVTQEFADSIGAHGYFQDPPSALEYVNANCA